LQSSVFAQGLEIDAKSDFSAELAKLVVRATRCDQFEPSPDGARDSLATGFTGSLEKLFRDFYGDFFCLRHRQIVVIYSPAAIPVMGMASMNGVPTVHRLRHSPGHHAAGLRMPWRRGRARERVASPCLSAHTVA